LIDDQQCQSENRSQAQINHDRGSTNAEPSTNRMPHGNSTDQSEQNARACDAVRVNRESESNKWRKGTYNLKK
jgi:hypothetical protein